MSENATSNGSISGAEIELKDVVKHYPGQSKSAVESLSLTIPAGEVVMFIGPSGCGKTTSLKMINRLIEPTSGQILIGGEDSRKRNENELRRTIGYVIQGGSLFPHMTVGDNIALVPGLLGWDKSKTSKRVDELLDLVNLDPSRYRNRYPRELSGGQQQRVGVARGLAADPPVILMDEPFGAVDPITRQKLQDELMSIQRELRKTIVCVTHDIDEAIKLGDRILILQEGAKIAQYDSAEAILAAPANSFVEDFVGAGSGLKQLSLTRVDDVGVDQQLSATIGESIAEVKQRGQDGNYRSVVILDDRRRPRDWVWLHNLQGDVVRDPGEEQINTVDRRATLNDALDTMLVSSHDGVVVTGDGDEYVGVINFGAVTSHMLAAQQQVEDSANDPLAVRPEAV